jgi:hypothetical protein
MLRIPSAVFTGEAQWCTVGFPGAGDCEFLLGAPTGDELAEYQKRQGLDEAVFAAQFNSNEDIEEADEDDIMKGRVKLLPVERRVSNAKQHAADRWLVMKKVKDWRGDGTRQRGAVRVFEGASGAFANEPESPDPSCGSAWSFAGSGPRLKR